MKFPELFKHMQFTLDMPATFEKIELPPNRTIPIQPIDESTALLAVALALQAAGVPVHGEIRL